MHTFMRAEKVCTLRGTPRAAISRLSDSATSRSRLRGRCGEGAAGGGRKELVRAQLRKKVVAVSGGGGIMGGGCEKYNEAGHGRR